MNQLINISNQTPIEIVLDIDEKGMTTAKKLYELAPVMTIYFSRLFSLFYF